MVSVCLHVYVHTGKVVRYTQSVVFIFLHIETKFYSDRLIRLLEEIMSEKENKTIIFVETKRRCDELTRRMRRDGYVSLSFMVCVVTFEIHTLLPSGVLFLFSSL